MTLINWLIKWFWGRSNCLFYAIGKWRRDGGYLVLRPCRKNRFCMHWLHCEGEGEPFTQYTIQDGAKQPGWFGKMFYRGRIKEGDSE